MQVRMVQHAVGQGGLFSGELTGQGKPLRWVYDCGSNQRDALRREIKTVAGGGDIDMLFLSHLDSDHVGGVDELLGQVKVREVVLPYLNEQIVLATMARDASSGALSGTFVEATNDLAAWFGSRGVETITFVGGPEEEDGGDGPSLPIDPSDGREGECRPKWTQPPQAATELIADPNLTKARPAGTAMMMQVAPGAAVQLVTPTGAINWALIPYVHMPSAKQMRAFEQALEDAFSKPLDKKAIVASAKDPDVRDKLRDCYDALWLDHNLITMTLYCGPLKPHHAEVSVSRFRHHPDWWHELGGWMLTGDAHLDGLRRRQGFLRYYQRVTPLTNVLMLPHHGSIHNHSDLVLDAMPELIVGYAAAGPNSYGHPHDDVTDAVNGHRRAHFHRVSKHRSHQLEMRVQIP
ncbi:hypothetical protein M2337_002385 [Sphingobium sp. B2D3A]|uniref:MBL fold metallo-hydrolase n=2 Tax=unclassified Sphingobium TaxID=2611147 RepID=UPI002224B729|nr:MBL fold metallo-hydrolase [Sphingobium sp. B2D3A]MCW2338152.1 hypothetical protein [Sphingobium sp. B2D3A]MCW2384611.1 hypothetical protein [Sphingobium sp. B2D3D]